jgi:hypothetical protein
MNHRHFKRAKAIATWNTERNATPDDADWLRFIPDNTLRPPVSLGWGYLPGDEDKLTWLDERDAERYDISGMGKYVPTGMDWSPNFPIDLVHVRISLCWGIVSLAHEVIPEMNLAGGFKSNAVYAPLSKPGHTMYRVVMNGADDGGMAAEFPPTPQGERDALYLYNRIQGFETYAELEAFGLAWDG